MTLAEILALARVRLTDTVPPYRWSDDFLTDAANNAVLEACQRARLIFDVGPDTYPTVEDPVTRIDLEAGELVYPLSPLVQLIARAYVDLTDYTASPVVSQKVPVTQMSAVSSIRTSWALSQGTYGVPLGFFLRPGSNSLVLVQPPDKPYILRLEVYRRPKTTELLVNPDDVPPIDEAYHRHLVWWVLREAHNVRDADLYNPDRGRESEAQFTAAFGLLPSAKAQRMSMEAAPSPVMRARRF